MIGLGVGFRQRNIIHAVQGKLIHRRLMLQYVVSENLTTASLPIPFLPVQQRPHRSPSHPPSFRSQIPVLALSLIDDRLGQRYFGTLYPLLPLPCPPSNSELCSHFQALTQSPTPSPLTATSFVHCKCWPRRHFTLSALA